MNQHSFHIPVMGIGFTIDTPVKVSHLGIDSVVSLVDDILLEKLRKMYCITSNKPYIEITDKEEDFRAKRITSYLNLMNSIAEDKIQNLKSLSTEYSQDLKQYFNLLPDTSGLKTRFKNLTAKDFNLKGLKNLLSKNLTKGSIDVNIMTKVDKENYDKDKKLPPEFNDAHAALRGFAMSNLNSSVILSAGMNPRLFSYIEEFEDFFPNTDGEIKKKIVLKVSDFRSALIQGKFLAKKGLWVSEYRIESGLNCGGHAFATDGYLMGPILSQFRDEKSTLITDVHQIMTQALSKKGKIVPSKPLPLKITAQGGVGTSEEHQFLLEHYQVDSVGWGSPFLLVPEATTVDNDTLKRLAKAKEKDLYLSNISPLGVPFNSLIGNTKDQEKLEHINNDKPGSVCPKRYVALNKEFSDRGMCTASREYQYKKIKALKKLNLTDKSFNKAYHNIIEKSCACVGLGTSALLKYNLDTTEEGKGVSVCPGPNMAYFSKVLSLKEMTNHIYGASNSIENNNRPNMFTKELNIYIQFLKNKMETITLPIDSKQQKYFSKFIDNLNDGITYYEGVFSSITESFKTSKLQIMNDLEKSRRTLNQLESKFQKMIYI